MTWCNSCRVQCYTTLSILFKIFATATRNMRTHTIKIPEIRGNTSEDRVFFELIFLVGRPPCIAL